MSVTVEGRPSRSNPERVKLTDTRRLELSDSMAVSMGEMERLEDHKKSWVKNTTEAITMHKAIVSECAKKLREGYEMVERG